jgi:hypothetical protein
MLMPIPHPERESIGYRGQPTTPHVVRHTQGRRLRARMQAWTSVCRASAKSFFPCPSDPPTHHPPPHHHPFIRPFLLSVFAVHRGCLDHEGATPNRPSSILHPWLMHPSVSVACAVSIGRKNYNLPVATPLLLPVEAPGPPCVRTRCNCPIGQKDERCRDDIPEKLSRLCPSCSSC